MVGHTFKHTENGPHTLATNKITGDIKAEYPNTEKHCPQYSLLHR